MRLTRCYVALPMQAGARVVLPELVANHLARVLRLREGDACSSTTTSRLPINAMRPS